MKKRTLNPILAQVTQKQLEEFFDYIAPDLDSVEGDLLGWVFKGTEEQDGNDGGDFELEVDSLTERLLDGRCRVVDLLKAAYRAGHSTGYDNGKQVMRDKLAEFGRLLLGKI